MELAEHTRQLGRGGSAPVVVTEDVDIVLDSAGLAALCRLFVCGELSAGELAYTADALQMAERVEYSAPDIADDLAVCTDPDINGPLTVARALEIARRDAGSYKSTQADAAAQHGLIRTLEQLPRTPSHAHNHPPR